MISETRREHLRRIHRPTGTEDQCAVAMEPYPCDAIQLLDELEQVEAVARTSFDQIREEKARELWQLQNAVTILESKIRRAAAELS